MKRAYLWSTDIDETQEFCQGCGGLLSETRRRFCDVECRHIVATRWPTRKRRYQLNYWNRKNEFVDIIFKKIMEEFPYLALLKEEDITAVARKHRVYRWAMDNIPGLKQFRKEWMAKVLGKN